MQLAVDTPSQIRKESTVIKAGEVLTAKSRPTLFPLLPALILISAPKGADEALLWRILT